jgi:hypothetical protein
MVNIFPVEMYFTLRWIAAALYSTAAAIELTWVEYHIAESDFITSMENKFRSN